MKLGTLAITLLSAGATALIGCAQDGDVVTKDKLEIEQQVLPKSDSMSYAGFARVVTIDGQSKEVPVEQLKLSIQRDERHQRVAFGVGRAALKSRTINERGQAAAGDSLGAADELLRALPPAGRELRIGDSYESPAPSTERIQRNHADAGTGTMVTHTVYTPTHIMSRAGVTVLRVSTVSSYRLYFINEATGTSHQFDLGIASKGVVDLAHAKDEGWRVMRLARITPTDKDEYTKTATLADLRGQPHKAFTACLRGTSSSATMKSIAGLALPLVPELSACDR